MLRDLPGGLVLEEQRRPVGVIGANFEARSMRITADQRAANEDRIRAATGRLLHGEVPPGGRCDIKTLAREAGVDRTAFYGSRPYAHLREEFDRRLRALGQAGDGRK